MSCDDYACIVGGACRLPGGVLNLESAWMAFNKGDIRASKPPRSRGMSSFTSNNDILNCRWLGNEGIDAFDSKFFGVSDAEAKVLRPNTKLGLELTYEALENAGIPPLSLQGNNVSVSIGMGTEDGWDMNRWNAEGSNAFDVNWAASSDPSGVAGRISFAFDFRGSCSTLSNACASGAFALKKGIDTLFREDAEIAIVGGIATFFSPAALSWANATAVASPSHKSSAFSVEADGYCPSEGAVFFVLKRLSKAYASQDSILAIIKSVATAHYGATRSLMFPNLHSQISESLARKALEMAGVTPEEIYLVEAHGTGTPVGDAIEAEGIKSIYQARTTTSLMLSSSKTVFGHTHGAAALVGLLKIVKCFEHHLVPPHHATPLPDFCDGPIQISNVISTLPSGPIYAQLNSFGFTGSIATVIVQSPPQSDNNRVAYEYEFKEYLLTFSAKSKISLHDQIQNVYSWAKRTESSLLDIATALTLCRDHHPLRCALVVTSLSDLERYISEDYLQPPDINNCYSLPQMSQLLDLLAIDAINDVIFSGGFTREQLSTLIDAGSFFEAACLLYNRGHDLNFKALYTKSNIRPARLRSFPTYSFDRQFILKPNIPVLTHDTPSSTAPTDSQDSSQPITQKLFEDLIDKYSTISSCLNATSKDEHGVNMHVLLTGGNGMLGVMLLNRLLSQPNIHLYCIIRGNPRIRMHAGFQKHNKSTVLLQEAESKGILMYIKTTDLCGPKLGISEEDYSTLLKRINCVVHAAWPVNFNLPLHEFYPFLQCTRALAELCLEAKKMVRYHFIGSYASTFNYPSDRVPETRLEPLISHSLMQGYALSKLVAEHALLRIHALHSAAFELAVVRVGQICGDVSTGQWSLDEMMPMIISSLPDLGCFPASMPPVSWIPSDVCADALRDVVLLRVRSREDLFFHLANPTVIPWVEVAQEIAAAAGLTTPKLLTFPDYVEAIKQHPNSTVVPVARLLPYFTDALRSGTMPERYACLDVCESSKLIRSLSSCPPVKSKFLRLLVNGILSKSTPSPISAKKAIVVLFGPWSSLNDISPDNPTLTRISKRASLVRETLAVVENENVSTFLENQLRTFAAQLWAMEELAARGVKLRGVIGYCFGEYAAAVSAGIISERTAVEIIVRRAFALDGTEGAMLNVFSGAYEVRKTFACMKSPPSIAIIAGPNHIVISGTNAAVSEARTKFTESNIKTNDVHGFFPFHSTLMQPVISRVALYEYLPKETNVAYVSSVTASALPGLSLGMNYWLRHLRDPVDFYGAMRYARRTFGGCTFVDVSPGLVLKRTIKRYDWTDVNPIGVDEIFATPVLEVTSSEEKLVVLNEAVESYTPQDIQGSTGASDLFKTALQLLNELFGYDPSPKLLSKSLYTSGIQSLDFIRFADYLKAQTGVRVPVSSYISDLSLRDILEEARGRTSSA